MQTAPVNEISNDQTARVLAYAGFVVLSFELVKSLIVEPIKFFYSNIDFGKGMPFTTYEKDVRSRHKYEFQSCLLYLKDFMQVLDSEDVTAIQEFREHRNDIAHELPKLVNFNPENKIDLLKKVDTALFKLSNHNEYMEIGADPAFKDVDWNTAYGNEYALFKKIIENVESLKFIKNCNNNGYHEET